MLEWLKRHAWKACMRQKRIGGSNPPHSARREHWMRTQGFVIGLPLSLKESPSLRKEGALDENPRVRYRLAAFSERIPLTPQGGSIG